MEVAHLVVARFLKPHGLKGEVVVQPLTDEPEEVFVVGRTLRLVSVDGVPSGDGLVIERARPFQRRWLLAFEGLVERDVLDPMRQRYLGARQDELRAPDSDELYVHEIPGSEVFEGGVRVAVATSLVGVPGGQLLVVEREGQEHLIPFCRPFVVKIDRTTRRIEVELPTGLFDV